MLVFFIWIGATVVLLALYSLSLWMRNRKRSRFQAKLTVLFLLFMMIPSVPLTLFVASLLTQSADMLLLPGIGHALETSLSTIRLQAEQKGRVFLEEHPDSETWDADLLRLDGMFFAGLYRQNRGVASAVRVIRTPGCIVPPDWLPGPEAFREPADSLQSGCITTPRGETWMSVCKPLPGPSLAVVGYTVSPSVLEAKQGKHHQKEYYLGRGFPSGRHPGRSGRGHCQKTVPRHQRADSGHGLGHEPGRFRRLLPRRPNPRQRRNTVSCGFIQRHDA
jgi:hypothetical protein